MNKHILDDIQFYEEDGAWYARMKYILEDDHEIREVIIPKVSIGINRRYHPEFNNDFDHRFNFEVEGRLSLGPTMFRLYSGVGHDGANHVLYTEKLLKKKTKKMTVAEIEKKLGYKIEIVSEE